MKALLVVRRGLKWTAVLLTTLIVLTAGLIAAVDAGYGHSLLIRCFAWRLGRPVQVAGRIQTHLFSLTPRLIADHVTIGNPPWTPSGVTVEAGSISVVLRLPGLWHPVGILGLDLEATTLNLIRDSAGRANWQLRDPSGKKPHKNSPILRTVMMPNAHVVLADDRRHLHFVGTVSAHDFEGPGAPQPLRIKGAGQLNDRPVNFEVTADPLPAASHKAPYHFTFSEHSSGSRLDGQGELPQPFSFEIADATFTATGPDLKDLYFLTGVHLIDTGNYRLSGQFSRRGTLTNFHNLTVTSGGSDVSGYVSSDSASDRPKFNVDLNSRLLKSADLGARAAGRAPGPKPPLLLSDAMISPNVLHVAGAAVKYHADRVELGRLPFEGVSLDATIGQNILTVRSLLATLSGGRVTAHLTLDGRKESPAANVDLTLTGVQLGQFFGKDARPPPIEGTMQARVKIAGTGRSVHQIAASANGTVTAQMTGGALRESFAELTDVDLRALGLLLTRNKQDVPVRCAIARFKAQVGTLTARDLIMDTDAALITGEGQVHLDSETLDLGIHGNPKSLRLFRLRTPVLVQGTLVHPAFHIKLRDSHLMVTDPGRARDADCAALLPE